MSYERSPGLLRVHNEIVNCERCPRLRHYCQQVAQVRKRAHRDGVYWARPVPGFGDPDARVLLVGLAPAAHGANRTGRVFTGDGVGGSGDFLMAALHRAGFANRDTSQRVDDGLALTDAYIVAAVRCAPPDNTPTPEELIRCLDHFDAEVAQLARLQVVVALGRIAWDAWLRLLTRRGLLPTPRPRFGHGAVTPLGAGLPTLVGCYHPSRQNTNTGRLTTAMMDEVFLEVRRLAGRGSPDTGATQRRPRA